MIAMSVLSILATGTIGITMQSRYQAEYLVYQNAAYTAAQGYLEQIKTMEYNIIEASVASNPVPLPTKALSYSGTAAAGTLQIDDPIYINTETEKTVLIDISNLDSGSPEEISMPFHVTVLANDLSSFNLEAMEIIIDFRYETPHMSGRKESYGTVRTVVTSIK